MNTRDIAAEYRLAHWAGIMREREESGLLYIVWLVGRGLAMLRPIA